MPDGLYPIPSFRVGRSIRGMSAILLPMLDAEQIDWNGFDQHVLRTADLGLVPAVNMDTGYANLIDEATRMAVLERTGRLLGGREFVAGAFVSDGPGVALNQDGYLRQIELIQSVGGTPIVFQSFGLVEQSDDQLIDFYRTVGRNCDRFLAFELGSMFAPFGKIYSTETYRALLGVPQCFGAKHSSLMRGIEWERIRIRDQVRPDFLVLTGNDLAIDMVFYGSDYLLGLSTFAPREFALRDRLWMEGDHRAIQLNDILQYIGAFAFRDPVPAYKHSAAMFLHLQGMIATDQVYPGAPTRPASDREILKKMLEQLNSFVSQFH